MLSAFRSPKILFLMPVFVLIFTRIAIEISARLLPINLSWIPAFASYYLCIEICLWIAKNQLGIVISSKKNTVLPIPAFKQFFFGILLPALIPFGVFISNYKAVPNLVYVYIVVFALINPFFEETFWRGLFNNLPIAPIKRQVLSGFLFSFSHYFLWGSYWLSNPRILIPTCVTTFIMGWCWMWFYQKDGRLIYPILSHIVVDMFNLSIAVFLGMKLANT
ncbi:MAG: CPBP family intramembrane metalloprotease [Sphingobacteriaceae bacterium]|nr:MAG: CPBP family intramembrane metalloprotease [Sphingobacteriaceae bacterium]